MKHSRVIKDPLDFLRGRGLPPEAYSHIVVNPALSRLSGAQYDVIRQSTHDGSGNFTEELIKDVLAPLVMKYSFYKPIDKKPIRYEVGLLRWSIVYGDVDLPAGRMRGQKERMRLPVRCIYE